MLAARIWRSGAIPSSSPFPGAQQSRERVATAVGVLLGSCTSGRVLQAPARYQVSQSHSLCLRRGTQGMGRTHWERAAWVAAALATLADSETSRGLWASVRTGVRAPSPGSTALFFLFHALE